MGDYGSGADDGASPYAGDPGGGNERAGSDLYIMPNEHLAGFLSAFLNPARGTQFT